MFGKFSPFSLRSGEVVSYLFGTVLIVIFISQLAQGEVQRRQDIAEFEEAFSSAPAATVSKLPALTSIGLKVHQG
jgi:hypothetical protein